MASEPALPNHFGDEQQIGSDLLLAQNVLIGRYFNVVNNKRSNKKCRIHKILITSILQMLTIALLRRWLWVRAPPNPVSFALVAWIYILRGSCGRYYIGSTQNLDRRLAEHRRGNVHSTRRFGQPSSNLSTCAPEQLPMPMSSSSDRLLSH